MSRYGYVLSLNSRGVPTFKWHGVSTCGAGAARAWKNFGDIGLSWLVFVRLLNSNSWLSLFLVFFCTLFYLRVLHDLAYLDNVWTIYCFLIVLPILILVVLVYLRRERALQQGAHMKVALLALFHLHHDFLSQGGQKDDVRIPQLRASLHSLLDHMQAYFNHSRPTATHFYWPYGPADPLPGSVLGDEAVSIHLLSTAVLTDIKRLMYTSQALRAAGAGEAVLLRHGQLVADVHLAFQKMALIKEMRTPLVLRSCSLFYSIVILPLLLGPFWAVMARSMGFIFASFVALLTHSIILGLLNLTVMYEDPYDDKVTSQSVDSVSVVELADACKWLLEDDDIIEPFPGPTNHPVSEQGQPTPATHYPSGNGPIPLQPQPQYPAPVTPHNPLYNTTPPRPATANGSLVTLAKLQFTHGGEVIQDSLKRATTQLRSPASAVSPPMPPIIGSGQFPEMARSEYDA